MKKNVDLLSLFIVYLLSVSAVASIESKLTFEPEVVEDINPKKKFIASPMLRRAELTTQEDSTRDSNTFSNSPNIYSTIVPPRQTQITKQRLTSKKKFITPSSPTLSTILKVTPKEVLKAGEFSLPVQLGNDLVSKDPTKIDYKKPQTQSDDLPKRFANVLVDQFNESAKIDSITLKRIDVTDEEDLQALKNKIKNEAKDILDKMNKRISELKDVSQLKAELNNLLVKVNYSLKEKQNQNEKNES